MELTVERALHIGALAQCKLLGGSSGVERIIQWVDTMEIPEIAPWLKKNELLITTGYAIKNEAGALMELLRDLHRAQAAGIAIKTRFLGSISSEAIALADTLQIPLIEIPSNVPFIDITHPLMKALVDEHNQRLEFSEQLNVKFLELELNIGGFREISQMLSNLIRQPVLITSADFTVLAWEPYGISPPIGLFIETEGNKRLSPAIAEKIGAQNSLQQIIEFDDIPLLFRCARVKKQTCGYLVILCREGQLDEMQQIAVNHAATSLALEFAKQQVLENHIQMMDSNLLIDLLSGNIHSAEEADDRAQTLHWPIPPVRVAVADIDQFETVSRRMDEADIQQLKERIRSLIRQELSFHGIAATVISKSDSFTCLMGNGYEKKVLTGAFQALQEHIIASLGLSMTIGISEPRNAYLLLPECYAEARDAICISRRLPYVGAVVAIADAHLERVFLQTADAPYVRRFVEETLGALEEYDRCNHTALLQTLEALIRSGGSRKETAEALFLHRNTLSNRIQKLEQITGCNLSDSDSRFRLELALKYRNFC